MPIFKEFILNKLTKRSIKAFTLVELLITLAIIMILTAVATPTVIGYINRSKISRAQMEMGYLKTSIQVYFNDWGIYPTALTGLRGDSVNAATLLTITGLTGPIDYLGTPVPKDIFKSTTEYSYSTNTAGTDFVIWSCGPDKVNKTTPTFATNGVVTWEVGTITTDDIIVRP